MVTVFQSSKASPVFETRNSIQKVVDEKVENYLTHPTLGLLYSVCELEENVELFTTIYAKRLFFVVTSCGNHVKFESIGRQDARLLVEKRLCQMRSATLSQEYNDLRAMYQQTFG
ncbi:MAG TPA: PipX family protein [Coleofasciculaceae cyanobacterium]